MSCVKLRQTHVFIIFAFRSFPVSSPFVLSSECRRSSLWKSWKPITFRFSKEKSTFLNSRLAVFTFAWIFPPPPWRPPFSFECVSVRVYMKVRPHTPKYKFAKQRSWKRSVLRFLSCSGSALLPRHFWHPLPPFNGNSWWYSVLQFFSQTFSWGTLSDAKARCNDFNGYGFSLREVAIDFATWFSCSGNQESLENAEKNRRLGISVTPAMGSGGFWRPPVKIR